MLTSEIVDIDAVENFAVHYVDSKARGAWCSAFNFPHVKVGQTWVIVLNGSRIITTALIPMEKLG